MKIINESAFKKIILLLICTEVMILSIGNAVASDLATATQGQAGYISVTNGDVSYGLGQQQSAKIISGDGEISAAQQSGVNVDTKGNGKVTFVTARENEVQSVDMASSDGSTNNDNQKPNKVKVKLSVLRDGSGYIDAGQVQTEQSSGDIYQQQTGVLKIKETPNKIKGTIILKQT